MQAGFSILELSVVLTVISLVIGSALAIGAARMQAAKVQDTETKLEAILDTIDLFVQEYGFIPCPANPQAGTTDADFGAGTVDGAGDCTAANLLSADDIRIGVVPTATLRMAPAVMMDGWGRRITYIMDTRLNTAAKYAATDPDAAPDAFLTIQSTSGTDVTNKAVMVLLSHGPDGHMAWRAKGGPTRLEADPVPTGDAEENANDDAVFIQKLRDETFDDMVQYRMKWQFPAYVP